MHSLVFRQDVPYSFIELMRHDYNQPSLISRISDCATPERSTGADLLADPGICGLRIAERSNCRLGILEGCGRVPPSKPKALKESFLSQGKKASYPKVWKETKSRLTAVE